MSKRRYRISPAERLRRRNLMLRLRAEGRAGEQFLPRWQARRARQQQSQEPARPGRIYINLRYPELSQDEQLKPRQAIRKHPLLPTYRS
jgi:hypothetical protein